jgi:hypothetical protein
MEKLISLFNQLIGYICMPLFVPYGILRIINVINSMEINHFKDLIHRLPEDLAERDREGIDGEKKILFYHNCASAVFMLLPFSLVATFTQLFARAYWTSLACFIFWSISFAVYIFFRHTLTVIDFDSYSSFFNLTELQLKKYYRFYFTFSCTLWIVAAKIAAVFIWEV